MYEEIYFEGVEEHKLEDKVHRPDRKLRVLDVGFIDAYVHAQVIEHQKILTSSANTPSVRYAIHSLSSQMPSPKSLRHSHRSPSDFIATALFRDSFPRPVPLYFHQKIVPKMSTMKLIQAIIIHSRHEMLTSLFPCSHSSQISRNRSGSSVSTPSSSLFMHHLIMSGSLTVHAYIGLPFAFTSRMKRAPKTGNISVF